MIELRGNTWGHPRGLAPMLATADAYMALYPDVRIVWTARKPEEFPDFPIERLADSYDMMVIDHPIIGEGVHKHCLVALDEVLEEAYLYNQAVNSVGKSHISYQYNGHQWALAIDAAAHVSAYRADLLERLDTTVPRTWEEVRALASRLKGERGWMALPLLRLNTLMVFCSLCANAGEEPFTDEGVVVSHATGRYALSFLRELYELSHPASASWDPPVFLEYMSHSDELIYCPLTFGYSNYARPQQTGAVVTFTDIPLGHDDSPSGAILGGTGLAISNRSKHIDKACAYAAYVASAPVQRTTYFTSGGQPGHRASWLDPQVNAASGNFFLGTLTTLDCSYLRPIYPGFIELQERSSQLISDFLQRDGDIDMTLDHLDRLYSSSR